MMLPNTELKKSVWGSPKNLETYLLYILECWALFNFFPFKKVPYLLQWLHTKKQSH